MGRIKIKGQCPNCGKEWSITAKREDLESFDNGMPVQEAFPYLSETEREHLLSGLCAECQDYAFAEDLLGDYDDDIIFGH